jgi:hypothetical protein
MWSCSSGKEGMLQTGIWERLTIVEDEQTAMLLSRLYEL